MPPPRQNILEIEGLTLSYRARGAVVRAMDGVNLVVGDGEAVGLVGESGSGKSSLARVVLGLVPERVSRIEAGRIVIAGRDVTRLTQAEWEGVRGNPVAIVFQDPLSYLNPVMQIGRQIAESILRHTPDLKVAARVDELLELVRLPPACATAYPHELSGGMRQRALLAIALACRPRLLIADEPTTALDVTTQAEILALLKDLRQRLGMAMLLISHDLGIVASACERIYVMYAGHTVEWGRTQAVFGYPAHPYTIGLLKAAQAARNAQGRFATISGDPPNLAELPTGCPFVPRCPYAMAECSRAMPGPFDAQGDAGHTVRCWRYHETASGIAVARPARDAG
ncbi:MAG: ABC transporter ATP-binding protein [Proteobacteria bacterium]|nr:ABC transporter ATP-binding protein [Pseudomonadota bacterium]